MITELKQENLKQKKYSITQCFISGYENGAPVFAIIVMIPVMLVGGGLEEAGWRYILQPELEKMYSFTISTIIVSIIWWLWHLLLFYIQGVFQYGQNYIAFGISILGLSFALASIRKNTGSVWLCVLFHCIENSLSGIFVIKDNIWGNITAAIILILCSCALLKINNRKKYLIKEFQSVQIKIRGFRPLFTLTSHAKSSRIVLVYGALPDR